MGTTSKPTDVLDGMLGHVRYEAVKAVNFCRIGNGWCYALPGDGGTFAAESVLEAGLIHFRCLIEFLGNKPEHDKVMARDYLPDWPWTIGGSLVRVGELHGRLAHLGTIRHTAGDFNWAPWLAEHAPIVLGAFRDFLRDLRDVSPARFELVDKGDPPDKGNLLAALDELLGP
jgi:hypothetical protein